jgi:SAM-dependent methyltransferase
MTPLRRLYLRFIVPPTPFRMDPELERLVEDTCRSVRGGRVLNVGSGRTRYPGRVVNVDLEAFPGVQLLCDAHRLPFDDSAFDVVLLRGVLEHVRSADTVLSEVRRVLKLGGLVYVEVPFLQPFHASPEDYRRFTLAGLSSVMCGYEGLRTGVQIGPASTLAWVAQEALAAVCAFGSTTAYKVLRALLGWALFWVKFLDRMVVPAPFVANSASALYYLGRKIG